MQKPKILYIIGQLARGGAEQQLYYLLKSIEAEVTVVSLSHGGYWANPIRELGHTVIELENNRRFELNRLNRLMSIIRAFKPDIIHIFLDGVSGLYGRIGAIALGYKNVIIGERIHPDHYPWWFKIVATLLNHRAKFVVCNSYAACQSLIQRNIVPAEKTLVILNGIDIVAIQRANRINNEYPWLSEWRDKPIVGMVAQLYPKKNPALFVRIAHSISKIRPDARFVMVGDGPSRSEMKMLVTSLGLDNRFLFTGVRNDVLFLLHNMNIFALTSRREGMPNVILEAMAVGLPCVVSDVGDCSRLVKDGTNGYVVPLNAEKLFVKRIVELLDNPKLRVAMGTKAATMAEEYTIPKMVEKYVNLYSSLLSEEKEYLAHCADSYDS